MKRLIVAVLAVSFLFTCFIIPAMAGEDKMLTASIQSVVQAKDKNGNPYVRVIVGEKRTLNGVDYEAGVPAMAFGPVAKQAVTLKEGGTLKAIVSQREFNGRTSYTILSILQ